MNKMEKFDWSAMTAPELNALAKANALVFVPVGSVEQHGAHLSTGTDAVLAKDVCYRVAMLLESECPVVVTPAIWFGLAHHHISFGGTFSVSYSTFKAVIKDVCDSVARAGFKRVLFVNGHGGNIMALATIASELSQDLDAIGLEMATTSYFMEAQEEFAEILEDQKNIMHACEGETSMMMAIAPKHLRLELLTDAQGPTFDMIPSLLPTLKTVAPFHELTPNGVSGNAMQASADKGNKLLNASAHNIAEKLKAGRPWRNVA